MGLEIDLMASSLKSPVAMPLSLHEFQHEFASGKNCYFMAIST